MKAGTLGIFSKEIFDPESEKYLGKPYIYLTLATDKTKEYAYKYPTITRTVFEVSWKLIEETTNFTGAAIYLSQSTTPEQIVQQGNGFKIYSKYNNVYRYHRVILLINERACVTYMHEKCLSYFTWDYQQ